MCTSCQLSAHPVNISKTGTGFLSREHLENRNGVWGRPNSPVDRRGDFFFFFFTLVTGPRRSLSLKLSDTRVYEPQIRARLGMG